MGSQDNAKREGIAVTQPEIDDQLFRMAVESAYEAVLITDAMLDPPGPRIIYVNPAFTRMTGYPLEEIEGKTPRILQGPDTDRNVLDRLRISLERGDAFEGRTVNYRKDGSPYDLEWRTSPIRSDDGQVRYYVAVQHEVTAQNRLIRALREQADNDPLTGAFNRRAMERALQTVIEEAQREEGTLAAILLDLDHFKRINDVHGHNTGDDVLQRVSEQISSRLRDDDAFARWGGEEFLIILPGAPLAGAEKVAESLRGLIEAQEYDQSLSVTASFGVAEWKPGDDTERLIHRADEALYTAKENGRNQVRTEAPTT